MPKAKWFHLGQYIQATGHGWTVYLDFLLSVIIKPFTAKHVDLFVYFGSRRGAKHVDLCGRYIFYILWFIATLCYVTLLRCSSWHLCLPSRPFLTELAESSVRSRQGEPESFYWLEVLS